MEKLTTYFKHVTHEEIQKVIFPTKIQINKHL